MIFCEILIIKTLAMLAFHSGAGINNINFLDRFSICEFLNRKHQTEMYETLGINQPYDILSMDSTKAKTALRKLSAVGEWYQQQVTIEADELVENVCVRELVD